MPALFVGSSDSSHGSLAARSLPLRSQNRQSVKFYETGRRTLDSTCRDLSASAKWRLSRAMRAKRDAGRPVVLSGPTTSSRSAGTRSHANRGGRTAGAFSLPLPIHFSVERNAGGSAKSAVATSALTPGGPWPTRAALLSLVAGDFQFMDYSAIIRRRVRELAREP